MQRRRSWGRLRATRSSRCDAQRVRGDGDAQAIKIYAEAFGQDKEFFAFYRSMEAYRSSFRGKNDLLLLEPSSDFFRYLRDPQGRSTGKK